MKKAIVIGLVAGVLLGLVGCANGGSPETDGSAGVSGDALYERTIKLTDGRTLTCVIYAKGYKGGVSCDWDGAE